MQVVQDNYNKDPTPTPPKDSWELICEDCGSVLNFTKDDVSIGEYGIAFVPCPLCGKLNDLYDHPETEESNDDFFNLTLTKDNIKFPAHFAYFKSKGEINEVFSKEVEEAIHKGIDYFRSNHDPNGYWYTFSGDKFVIVFPYTGDEDYYIVVAKGFYDTYIPFEPIDYQMQVEQKS